MVYSYSELQASTKRAKHLKANNQLQGIIRQIVFYMYAEILENIEKDAFRKRTSDARIELFEIVKSNKLIYINTLHTSSKRIKCFPCSKSEFAEDVEAIESAMKLVGLKLDNLKVYVEVQKEGS